MFCQHFVSVNIEALKVKKCHACVLQSLLSVTEQKDGMVAIITVFILRHGCDQNDG